MADTIGSGIADEPFIAEPAGHQLLDVLPVVDAPVSRRAIDERAVFDHTGGRRRQCVAISSAFQTAESAAPGRLTTRR